MTPLKEKIARYIRAAGPISVADYMSLCLADAEHGYYMRQEAFGIRLQFRPWRAPQERCANGGLDVRPQPRIDGQSVEDRQRH